MEREARTGKDRGPRVFRKRGTRETGKARKGEARKSYYQPDAALVADGGDDNWIELESELRCNELVLAMFRLEGDAVVVDRAERALAAFTEHFHEVKGRLVAEAQRRRDAKRARLA